MSEGKICDQSPISTIGSGNRGPKEVHIMAIIISIFPWFLHIITAGKVRRPL